MNIRRLLLSASVLGLVYAPAASAKYLSDVTPAPEVIPVQSDVQMLQTEVFDPDTTMTRATFTAMVVNKLYSRAEIDHCYWDIASTTPPTFTLLYSDVRTSDPYAPEICIALRDGLARGYADGSFHPNNRITFAESSKMLSKAYVLAPFAETNTRGPWFGPYALALSNRNAIPVTVTTFQHSMTAGETNDILERLSDNITWREAANYTDIERNSLPKPAPKPTVPHLSVQAPARTPVKPATPASASSSAASKSSASAASAAMGAEKSSEVPWYKFY